MLPIAPLMIEHRLMDRMIALLKKEADWMERDENIHAEFLDMAIDFINTYIDRCHHGKEEDVLLKELDRRMVADEHRQIMKEILNKHQHSRNAVTEQEEAKAKYLKGDRGALSGIIMMIRFLVELYPRHIEKEDARFFLPCMEYFNQEEKDAMLAQEYEFDRKLIHQTYIERVTAAEARYK
jgi:hemerythrin-like domain-containing protein